jgi:cobalt-zinc-cadmium efflux system membrane fusion protein
MKQKRIYWLAAALLLAALLVAAAYFGGGEHAAPAPAANGDAAQAIRVDGQKLHFAAGAPQLAYLKIEPVTAEPVPLSEPLNGRLAYDDNVTARVSAAVAGRLVKLVAQAGAAVRQGDLLAEIDAPDFAQAVADTRRAEADLRTKQAAFERAKMLAEGGVLAKKDFESADNDRQAAEAEAERARARYRNLDPGHGQRGGVVQQYALRAPLAGIVTERQANPGTEVRPDQANPLFVVSDPTRLWAIAELAEKDLGKVRIGQSVSVLVDAYPEQRFPAKVKAIGDVLDAQTRRVQVRCDLANDKRLLKPEMFARIVPESEGPSRPRLPNAALISEGLYTSVFVETEPGVVEKRRVKLAFRGQNESYVAEGVTAGERVVTVGALLLNAEMAGN